MARQVLINDADGMRWLRDVHLPGLPSKFKSAIVVGNEDYPTRIEVYERREPRTTDLAVVFKPDEEGVFRAQGTVTTSNATIRSNKAGTWEVEAGRGLTYDRHDGHGPLLMFNLHRVVNPRTSGSHIRPDELDEITYEIARFLNSKKRKVTPTDY